MAPDQKLTFAELYQGTHKVLFTNLRAFAAICFLPLTLMTAVGLLSLLRMHDLAADMFGSLPAMTHRELIRQAEFRAFAEGVASRDRLVGALYLVPIVMFSVRWQRFVLLGEAAALRLVPAFGRAYLLYFFYTVVIGLSMLAFLKLFVLVADSILDRDALVSSVYKMLFIFVLFILVALVVAVRLSLVLPASAVNVRGFGLARAWKTSKGQVTRLLSANFLAMFSALALVWVISWVTGQEITFGLLHHQEASIGGALVMLFSRGFCVLVATALQIGIAAHAFRRLTAWQP